MSPLDFVAHGILHIVQREAAEQVRVRMRGRAICYHPLAPQHEVPFQVLIDGLRLQGFSPKEVPFVTLTLTFTHGFSPKEVPFEAFQDAMRRVHEFAPLLHELRSGGRCSTRKMGTRDFMAALDGADMPASEVTPEVVSLCVKFILSCTARESGRDAM